MARIIAGPGKHDHPEHPLRDSVFSSESARHIIAIGLALLLVVMVVSALLLSANEGSVADRQAAAERISHAVAVDMK